MVLTDIQKHMLLLLLLLMLQDFGCTHPQRAANIMSRMYRMQDQAAADTLHSIMTVSTNGVWMYLSWEVVTCQRRPRPFAEQPTSPILSTESPHNC